LDIVNLAVLGIGIGGLNQQLPSLLLLAMTFRENNGSNGPREKTIFGQALCRLKFIARFSTQNNGNDGERPPPHSSWTAAIQSGRRDARRNQSHQRTQGNVLWQRGGRGRLRG